MAEQLPTGTERRSCPHNDAITAGREGYLFCLDCDQWIKDVAEALKVGRAFEAGMEANRRAIESFDPAKTRAQIRQLGMRESGDR